MHTHARPLAPRCGAGAAGAPLTTPCPARCAREPPRLTPPPPPRDPDPRAVSIESTGAMSAADLFREALRILADKARAISGSLDAALASDTGGVLPAAQAAKHTLAAMTLEPDDLS